VASIPVLVALWALWLRRGWTGDGPRVPARLVRPLLIGYLALAVGFTVFRNTPWGHAWRVA
jgi:hypothetical protein